MSKRKGKDTGLDNPPVSKRSKQDTETITKKTVETEFVVLQEKLASLNTKVNIQFTFISSIARGNLRLQLEFIKFFTDDVKGKHELIKLETLVQHNVKFSFISSILTPSRAQASSAFTELCEVLFIQTSNVLNMRNLSYSKH
jgi:hypothetical protein